ncbi:MAG: NUDIX domain-containing protein [Candidatus Heimdallarchaeota archaeon]|nr:MAG: NUDIX domain-containing protein [Candidatus Heimdallarchaeota archaeon]
MTTKDGKFTIGIGAIIEHTNSGKILLLHRAPNLEFAPNLWDDVGGRMRQFESPETTLQREVQEETGISQLTIVKPIDVTHYFRGESTTENEMIVITYWCRTASKTIRLSPEHDDYQWVYPDQALELIEDFQLQANIKRFIEEKEIMSKL